MFDRHNNVLTAVPEASKESLKQLMVESWSRFIRMRDKETLNHSERVTDRMAGFAHAMGMDDKNVENARRGALLHDIGKIGVPEFILQKPGPLTEDEWIVMKSHASLAYDMLAPFPFLAGPALDIAHYHHERWNGGGYPCGLKGEDIPLSARMFAIVDVYDALRSDRPYRKAWTEEESRAYLRTESGILFDPELVDMFLNVFPVSEPASPRTHLSDRPD